MLMTFRCLTVPPDGIRGEQCEAEGRQRCEDVCDDGENTSSSSQESDDVGPREEKALSDSEVKVSPVGVHKRFIFSDGIILYLFSAFSFIYIISFIILSTKTVMSDVAYAGFFIVAGFAQTGRTGQSVIY